MRNSANAIGNPSTMSTTTSTIIAMPTVRGSTSALQSTATSSAPSTSAATASQRRGSAAARARPACTTSWRASSTLAIAQPTTIKSLMGQTWIVKMPSTPANSFVSHARTKSGQVPRTIVSRMPIPSTANSTLHALAATGWRRESGSRNISTRMSRPCSTACASCKNTHATSESDTISVTPAIGSSSRLRAVMSAPIKNINANIHTTPAALSTLTSVSNSCGARAFEACIESSAKGR